MTVFIISHTARRLAIFFIGLFLVVMLQGAPVQAASPPANYQVLIIHSYHSGLSWTDSIIVNRPDSFYAKNKRYVWVNAVIIMTLCGFLILPGITMIRRRKAEIDDEK
jgi:hypothetical protein